MLFAVLFPSEFRSIFAANFGDIFEIPAALSTLCTPVPFGLIKLVQILKNCYSHRTPVCALAAGVGVGAGAGQGRPG